MFVAPPSLFGQHNKSHRLHSWALNKLQYRQDIHEDIREHNVQILQQNILQLKFEVTVKITHIMAHTYDIDDKHWISHIGTNNPSNCKADTKSKGYQEIVFFDWKIQL